MPQRWSGMGFSVDLSRYPGAPDDPRPSGMWVLVHTPGGVVDRATVIFDDGGLPYVVALELTPAGTRDVRVAARGDSDVVDPEDFRGPILGRAVSDLAAIGQALLKASEARMDEGLSWADVPPSVTVAGGSGGDALLHLLGLIEKRQERSAASVNLRQRVVDSYRLALAGDLGSEAKRAPRHAVAKIVFKSPAHVGRLLVEARMLGLLDGTTPGRKNRPDEETS